MLSNHTAELAEWARSYAKELLKPLGQRWAHTEAVARQARRAGTVLSDDERDMLVAAAYLHDVGYAPKVYKSGFHPLDGARHLEQLGVARRLCCLVAHHSAARFEAEERDLSSQLAAYELEQSPTMDALVYADMTTGPQGQRMTCDERLSEILRRYPESDPVHRAIRRATPVLHAAVARMMERLKAASR